LTFDVTTKKRTVAIVHCLILYRKIGLIVWSKTASTMPQVAMLKIRELQCPDFRANGIPSALPF
jgi:hypothetical protein